MTKKERYDRLIDMRLSGRKTPFTRTWTHRPSVVLLALIGVNLAAFAAQLFLESVEPGFVHDFLGICERGVQDAYAWQFITAAFMHGGPWHFIGNMFVLYLLGRDVESILGPRHFFSSLCVRSPGRGAGAFVSDVFDLRVASGIRRRRGGRSGLRDDFAGSGTHRGAVFLRAAAIEGEVSRVWSCRRRRRSSALRARRHGHAQRLSRRLRWRAGFTRIFSDSAAPLPCSARYIKEGSVRVAIGK